MLAATLISAGVQFVTQNLHGYTNDQFIELHNKHKHLIKWITKQSKVNELLSQELIDKVAKEDILTLRNLLKVQEEEAMLLILIAANLL